MSLSALSPRILQLSQLGTVSGYEVFVVVLAVAALVAIVGSSLLGILTRLVRGTSQEPDEPRRRRWWHRSPG